MIRLYDYTKPRINVSTYQRINKILVFSWLIMSLAPVLYADIIQEIETIKTEGGFEVDVSSLTKFYNTLTVDEKEEQVRDWAMFGLLSRLNLDRDQAGELLHQKFPLRLSYLKNVSSFEISPGRCEVAGKDDWIVILPLNYINHKTILTNLIDAKRVNISHVPARIHLFSYSAFTKVSTDTSTPFSIKVEYHGSIAGQRLFSSEYAYLEKKIGNVTEFKDWLSLIDDVVYVSWKEGVVILGGRKRSDTVNRGITLEDVATIYQAYRPPSDPAKESARRQEYEKFVKEKYKEVIKDNPGLKKQIQAGKVTPDYVYKEIRKRIPYTSAADEDVNVGFSLDPQKDFPAFADDINLLADYDPKLGLPEVPEVREIINKYRSRLQTVSADLKKENFDSYLTLRRELTNNDTRPYKMLDDAIRSIEHRNSYQCARYDGNLRGTSPGMILFYTDLNAKLWALNFDNLAPKNAVLGFRTMPDIKVPKLYWDEFLKLSNTRLWFGLKPENYNIRNKNLYFCPTVTRVYAASSNPLYPGKESEPNEQSTEFLGWWDRHYDAVADYEPQYYKLDQIQKWSCIFLLLKEEKVDALNFLQTVNVRRDYEFDKWYESVPDLKSKTRIPFVDRNKYKRDTECLLLMQSQSYPLMNQYFFLSGGVSLASKKDILSKLKKTEYTQTVKPSTKPGTSGTKGKSSTPPEKLLVKEQRTVKYEFPQKTVTKPDEPKTWKVVPKPGTKMRAPQMELATAKQEVVMSPKKQGIDLKYNLNNVSYGKFTTKNEQKKVVLNWTENDGCLLNDLLTDIVAKEETEKLNPSQILSSLSSIEKLTPKTPDKIYLVKLTNSQKWIQITVNPETAVKDKTQYIARASGTQPDSNIYEAKIISNPETSTTKTRKQ